MTKSQKIIALALALLIASMSTSPALAVKCRNSGTKSSGIKVGSQVDGDLVTICASKQLIKQLTRKVTVKPTATARPSMPTQVKPLPTAKKRVITKIPLAKPKSRIKVSTRVKNNSGLALFRPTKPVSSRFPLGVLEPNQSVTVSVQKLSSQGFTYLLGRLVRVRFLPNRAEWQLGDNTQAVGFSASHSYQNVGVYSAVARVRFRVAYRFSGGNWINDPDQIWLTSKPIQIPVGVEPSAAVNSKTVLVLSH